VRQVGFARTGKKSLGAALISLSFWQSVHATPSGGITDNEIALLPPFCSYTQSFPGTRRDPAAYEAYEKKYGGGWSHMHHYCWALVGMQRFERSNNNRMARNSLAMAAVNDIDYVLRNVDASFYFRFDIMTRKAKIFLRNGNLKEGRAVTEAVLKEWPDRADSYGLAAELEIASDRRGEVAKIFDSAQTKVKDPERLKQLRAVFVALDSQRR
jgi:hypothetical protein